jgi:hypothetical protein
MMGGAEEKFDWSDALASAAANTTTTLSLPIWVVLRFLLFLCPSTIVVPASEVLRLHSRASSSTRTRIEFYFYLQNECSAVLCELEWSVCC